MGKGNGKPRATAKPIDYVNYVVGVDFNESGDHAFWEAMHLAKRQPGVIVHVMHVLPEKGSIEEQSQALRDAAIELARYAQDHGAGIPGDHTPVVNAHVSMGDPAQRLLQLAADVNADMIFVGPNGSSGPISRILHGSTAQSLLRSGRAPVVVAHQKSFEGISAEEKIEAPCPGCLRVQRQTAGQQLWCDEHARPRITPHVYGPTELNRNVTFDSEVAATGIPIDRG